MRLALFPLACIDRSAAVVVDPEAFHLVVGEVAHVLFSVRKLQLALALLDPLAIGIGPLALINRPVDVFEFSVLDLGHESLNLNY